MLGSGHNAIVQGNVRPTSPQTRLLSWTSRSTFWGLRWDDRESHTGRCCQTGDEILNALDYKRRERRCISSVARLSLVVLGYDEVTLPSVFVDGLAYFWPLESPRHLVVPFTTAAPLKEAVTS